MGEFDEIWVVLPVVVVGLLLLPFVFGPVLIYLALVFPDRPEVVPLDENDPELPEELADHFERVWRRLARAGFEEVQSLAVPRLAMGTDAYMLVLANRRTKELAAAILVYNNGELKTAYTEIVTRFADGTRIGTQNSDELPTFKYPWHFVLNQFPMVDDPLELYRLHVELVERHEPASPRVLRLDEEFGGDAVRNLADGIVEELESQVASGYMRHRPGPSGRSSGGGYRPTVVGAMMMTWGQLWPFKAIRRARRDREARRLIDETRMV